MGIFIYWQAKKNPKTTSEEGLTPLTPPGAATAEIKNWIEHDTCSSYCINLIRPSYCWFFNFFKNLSNTQYVDLRNN